MEITDAALHLLAASPVDALSTRAIAKEVGLTQPGLFRHFRSRDDILAAVVKRSREEMAGAVQSIFDARHPPLQTLRAVLESVLSYAQEHPGVPRLLFHDIGTDGQSSFHRALRLLVSTQKTLLATLLEAAIAEHELPAELDARRAADIGVASLQGLLLQWQLADRQFDLGPIGENFIDHWIAGVKAGQPARDSAPSPEDSVVGRASGPAISVLDVRPILHGGVDPVGNVFTALDRLPPDGLLEVIAPFRPSPLLSLLRSRGFRVECSESEPAQWLVVIQPANAPQITDLRELEAPEPLERVLLAVEKLDTGQSAIFRLPRFPRLLLPHLEARGLKFCVHEEPDGSAILHARRHE